MAHLFRKSIIRYIDADGKRVSKDTPGSRKVEEKSRKWYGKGIPGFPKEKAVPLASDKRAAQEMLHDLVRKGERGQANLDDIEHSRTPLLGHLADFESHLQAKGSEEQHVKRTLSRIRRIINECGFATIADLNAHKVEQFLVALRVGKQELGPVEPDKEAFSRAEVAEILGIKPDCVSKVVRRHRLEANGNGKARTFPRTTVLALCEQMSQGTGPQTANYYLREMKSFCRWLVRNRRMNSNPLEHLQGTNVSVDVRRARRSFTQAELASLVETASASEKTFRGLSGMDRRMLYLTACGTGFRESELASLQPEWFHLDDNPPRLILPARKGKNRKSIIQPIPVSLVEELKSFLAGKSKEEPVWPGTWRQRGADMLRIDLDAAEIPYVIDGPDGKVYADFHSLRHSFVSLLDQSGASLKQAMQLARHSDPKLTMARYGRAQIEELGEAVNRLPQIEQAGEQNGLLAELRKLERNELERIACWGILGVILKEHLLDRQSASDENST